MHKYFLQDKNYILKGAQLDLQDELVAHLIEFSKKYYQRMYNPLGLMDDTMLKVASHSKRDLEAFSEYYDLLSAIYRYKFGTNQLEFLFDGMDHYTKYVREWREAFHQWLEEMLAYEPFLKTVLQLTVFELEGHNRLLAISRFKHYIHQHFELKIYKHKGIVRKSA